MSGTHNSSGWAQKYPGAVFVNEMELRKAKFDYARLGEPVPIDNKILDQLSKYEFSCFKLLEDASGWEFSFDERRSYYYDLLKYWNTAVHRTGAELFVSFNWPHVITAHTLYLLCKHCCAMNVLFIDPMPLINSNFTVIGTTMDDLAMPYRALYESSDPLTLGPETQAFLNRLRGNQWETASHNIVSLNIWDAQKTFQFREFARLLFYILNGKAFQEGHVAVKKNRLPFSSAKSRLTHFDFFWYKDRMRRKDMQLEEIYTEFCVTPDLTKKYIYFAAPQQPEVSTSIHGRAYNDVHLVLDLLCACVPEDWVIYYKEHPCTFAPSAKGSTCRNREYYSRIASYKNIQMISTKIDQFELIDRSQAVATVAGTTSWEAAVRGKPALFFGNVWYQACRSLYKIQTLQDCRNAIEQIIQGAKPDQKDIERYVSAIEAVGLKDIIKWTVDDNFKRSADAKVELERIAIALHEAYGRYYEEACADAGQRQ